jgi:hypothetical protein
MSQKKFVKALPSFLTLLFLGWYVLSVIFTDRPPEPALWEKIGTSVTLVTSIWLGMPWIHPLLPGQEDNS